MPEHPDGAESRSWGNVVSRGAPRDPRVRDVCDRQAKERMLAGRETDPMANLPQGSAREAAGKAVGVGGKSIDHATKVLTKGTPEFFSANLRNCH